MANVAISGDTSGAITLTVPAVAGTNTITLGNQTGTLWAAGPAFSAYKSAATQTPSSGVFTKVTFDVKSFDTNNNFASSTFTPTVAGYYQVNACVDCGSALITRALVAIYKNGSGYQYAGQYSVASSTELGPTISTVVYCNGSTDYLEVYARIDGGTVIFYNGSANTWFNATLVRGA